MMRIQVSGPFTSPLILILVVSVCCMTVAQDVETVEAKLFRKLLKNYNKNTRPVFDPKQQTIVSMAFGLKSISDMSWKDELLTWDPKQHNGTDHLIIPGRQIWLPEIAMLNSVDEGDDLSIDAKFRVRISPGGYVVWGPCFKWRTSCAVDLTYFPYDTQHCEISFTNWIYSAALLNYSVSEDASNRVNLELYQENDEWAILSTTADIRTHIIGGIMEIPVSFLDIHLQRKPLYFVMNMVAPCIMIAMLSTLVFCLPPESGEKISLAVTVTLSYTVVLLMISDITPPGSSHVPYITLYIVMNMGQTCVSLFLTIVVLNMHHHCPDQRLPRALRTLLLGCIGRLLCASCNKSKTADSTAAFDPSLRTHVQANADVQHKGSQRHSQMHLTIQGIGYAIGTGTGTGTGIGTQIVLPDDVMDFLRRWMTTERLAEASQRNRCEWQAAAKVLDRLLLTIFLLFSIVLSVGFLMTIQRGLLES